MVDCNHALINLFGLINIDSIGGNLLIWRNNALSSMSGLESTLSIGGDLEIWDNNALTNLSGMENIEATSIDNLRICNNNTLSTCEIQSICDYLVSPNGYIEIHDNASGCNSLEEVVEACETVSLNEVQHSDKLLIHPNPFSNSITIEYESTQSGVVEIKIYNQIGQLIEEFMQKGIQIENNSFIWQATDLLPGIYFIRLQAGNTFLTKKVIKLK